MASPRKGIRTGSETGSRRRTLIDDRSGVVVDISQSGDEPTPTLYIEVYPYPTGHVVEVTPVSGGHHSAFILYIRPRTTEEEG